MERSIIYTLNSLVYDREDKLITEAREIPKIPIGTKIRIYAKTRFFEGADDFTVYDCDEVMFYLYHDKYPCYKFSVMFENKKPLYSAYYWIKYCPEQRNGLEIECRRASRVDDFDELRIEYLSPDPYWNNLQLAKKKLAFAMSLNERLGRNSLMNNLDPYIITLIGGNIVDPPKVDPPKVDPPEFGDDGSSSGEDYDSDGFGGGGVRRKKKKRKSKRKRKKTRKKTRKRKSKGKKHKTKRRKS